MPGPLFGIQSRAPWMPVSISSPRFSLKESKNPSSSGLFALTCHGEESENTGAGGNKQGGVEEETLRQKEGNERVAVLESQNIDLKSFASVHV
ncbi:hypothetical protein NQZ68_004321 [Dissostichus eleginoides]|nr:hypothetical protein NQZ68_004321 [Dissostichus eleginoides]